MTEEVVIKKKLGFALLSKERLREIASKGGKSAHELGVGHEFTSEEARIAGKKGGQACVRKGRNKGGRQLNLPLEPEVEKSDAETQG